MQGLNQLDSQTNHLNRPRIKKYILKKQKKKKRKEEE